MSTPTESATDVERLDRAGGPMRAISVLKSVVRRELSTVVFRRTTLGLWVGLVAVFLGIAWFGGGIRAGYVSTIIDLLTPLELLIPVVAFVFGYRSILADERRGVLDVLETYPIRAWQLIAGVYLGRALGLVAVVSTALSALVFPIFVSQPYRPIFYATHTGADSPGLFLRFVVLTAVFALVMLAVAVAISALVGTARGAIAATALVLFVVAFVADIGVVFALSRGMIAETSLASTIAISPLSAYRGLVFETTVAVTAGTGPRTASPLASAVGLAGWWLGSLVVAMLALRS